MPKQNVTTPHVSTASLTIPELQNRIREVLAALPPYEQIEALEGLQAQGHNVGCAPDMMEVILKSWLSCYEGK